MQTSIADKYRDTESGKRADEILRRCVHCGFCNATCPTYLLLGDELDGPRGRIYQIKQLLEGNTGTRKTLLHLDRCLTCLNCETTCPSGVEYHGLIDIGREILEKEVTRPWHQRLSRYLVRAIIPHRARFGFLLRAGQMFRPLLPARIKSMVPQRTSGNAPVVSKHERKVLLLEGCVQPLLSPGINHACMKILDRLGIEAIIEPSPACCGALQYHTSAAADALEIARAQIDKWWPLVSEGVEYIVSTASGCGVHVKHYGELLANDHEYADKAKRISLLTRDIAEVVAEAGLSKLKTRTHQNVAFHPPCTLQHGQHLGGLVEKLLGSLGIPCVEFADRHLCCGAAGSYTLLQASLSGQLRQNKLDSIKAAHPDVIATANIGCIHHLAAGSDIPVKHWVEIVADAI